MAQGSGSQTYLPGYPGLCVAMLEGAVLDARGRKTCGVRNQTTKKAPPKAAVAKAWLAGKHKGTLSVHVCCEGAGVDYERFLKLLSRG